MSDNNAGATNGAAKFKIVCNGGQLTSEKGIEISENGAETKGLRPEEPAITIPLIPNRELGERE